MKLFISWSGEQSREVATALSKWFPVVLRGIRPFISDDIEKGSRWQAKLDSELDTTDYGILCLTQQNIAAPWLLYEAGALAKSVASSRVATILIDLKAADVEAPLANFQNTLLERADMFKLVKDINARFDDARYLDADLTRQFDAHWGTIETLVVPRSGPAGQVAREAQTGHTPAEDPPVLRRRGSGRA